MMTKQEMEAIDKMLDAAKLMDWRISFEFKGDGDGDEVMTGLIIGTKEFISKILETRSKYESWTTVSPPKA